jgi:hypothetical protein
VRDGTPDANPAGQLLAATDDEEVVVTSVPSLPGRGWDRSADSAEASVDDVEMEVSVVPGSEAEDSLVCVGGVESEFDPLVWCVEPDQVGRSGRVEVDPPAEDPEPDNDPPPPEFSPTWGALDSAVGPEADDRERPWVW